MFVGHYGVSFAAKRLTPAVPLWILFVAVQLVDVAWGILILLGVEKVRIVPGITATNPLDLYFMPYTHSLVAAAMWAVAGGIALSIGQAKAKLRASALVIGGAVFSHWVFDLIVHRPDLPLIGDQFKVGLGVWNAPAAAFLLEAALLFGGILIYVQATTPRSRWGRAGLVGFAFALLGLQGLVFFGAPPTSDTAAALTALAAYALLAVGAAILDRQRRPRADEAVSEERVAATAR